jgi:hypothetical protein
MIGSTTAATIETATAATETAPLWDSFEGPGATDRLEPGLAAVR